MDLGVITRKGLNQRSALNFHNYRKGQWAMAVEFYNFVYPNISITAYCAYAAISQPRRAVFFFLKKLLFTADTRVGKVTFSING